MSESKFIGKLFKVCRRCDSTIDRHAHVLQTTRTSSDRWRSAYNLEREKRTLIAYDSFLFVAEKPLQVNAIKILPVIVGVWHARSYFYRFYMFLSFSSTCFPFFSFSSSLDCLRVFLTLPSRFLHLLENHFSFYCFSNYYIDLPLLVSDFQNFDITNRVLFLVTKSFRLSNTCKKDFW